MNWKFKAVLILFGMGGGAALGGVLVGTGLAEILTRILGVLQ